LEEVALFWRQAEDFAVANEVFDFLVNFATKFRDEENILLEVIEKITDRSFPVDRLFYCTYSPDEFEDNKFTDTLHFRREKILRKLAHAVVRNHDDIKLMWLFDIGALFNRLKLRGSKEFVWSLLNNEILPLDEEISDLVEKIKKEAYMSCIPIFLGHREMELRCVRGDEIKSRDYSDDHRNFEKARGIIEEWLSVRKQDEKKRNITIHFTYKVCKKLFGEIKMDEVYFERDETLR
jgi:hypothetical protein